MTAGPTFDTLLSSPGPSQAPALPSQEAGGSMSNDHVLEAAKSNPLQVARIRAEVSREALKRLALETTRAANVL